MGYELRIMLLFCLLLSGCGSTKVADRVDVEVRDKSKVDVVEVHGEQARVESVATVTTDETVQVVEETVEVTYDTEKPADPATGKPPVKSEVVKKKTTVKGKQVQEQAVVSAESAVADSMVDRTQRDVDVDIEVEHEETPQKSSLAYVFYILLVVAVGVGVWLLNKKFGFVK
jgi:hypothetical protein